MGASTRYGFLQAMHQNRKFSLHTYSVQFSCSVVSHSLRPHESQHTRPPCPSQTPGVHSNSRPSSWWCHPAILSSVVPSSSPQSLPASESFPMSQLFTWGGHGLVQNWERNQDCQEKYQEPQICRWHHLNGRKQRETKEPLNEGERGEWKSWLKSQQSNS